MNTNEFLCIIYGRQAIIAICNLFLRKRTMSNPATCFAAIVFMPTACTEFLLVVLETNKNWYTQLDSSHYKLNFIDV